MSTSYREALNQSIEHIWDITMSKTTNVCNDRPPRNTSLVDGIDADSSVYFFVMKDIPEVEIDNVTSMLSEATEGYPQILFLPSNSSSCLRVGTIVHESEDGTPFISISAVIRIMKRINSLFSLNDSSEVGMIKINDINCGMCIHAESKAITNMENVSRESPLHSEVRVLSIRHDGLFPEVRWRSWHCADGENSDTTAGVLNWLTLVGNIASMICSVLTLVLFCLFPSMRTTPGKAVMFLTLYLLVAQTTFQFNMFFVSHQITCLIIAATQHTAWLSSFCWMNVLAFDLSITMQHITEIRSQDRRTGIVVYILYACGVPVLFVMTSLAVLLNTGVWPYVSQTSCWIAPGKTLIYLFAIPVALMILLNMIAFSFFVCKLTRIRQETEQVRLSSRSKHDFFIYFKLFSLMGITWIFGFLANIPHLSWCSYIFVVANTLQGTFIFFSFGLSSTMRQQCRQRFQQNLPATTPEVIPMPPANCSTQTSQKY